jgi:hypothetical protein
MSIGLLHRPQREIAVNTSQSVWMEYSVQIFRQAFEEANLAANRA